MIFRDFEQKIVKDINESGMPIDAIYFIMKNIMQEIEERYFEFCRQEDIEKIKQLDIKEKNVASVEEGDKKGDELE